MDSTIEIFFFSWKSNFPVFSEACYKDIDTEIAVFKSCPSNWNKGEIPYNYLWVSLLEEIAMIQIFQFQIFQLKFAMLSSFLLYLYYIYRKWKEKKKQADFSYWKNWNAASKLSF